MKKREKYPNVNSFFFNFIEGNFTHDPSATSMTWFYTWNESKETVGIWRYFHKASNDHYAQKREILAHREGEYLSEELRHLK